jgi:hypothetical protein
LAGKQLETETTSVVSGSKLISIASPATRGDIDGRRG